MVLNIKSGFTPNEHTASRHIKHKDDAGRFVNPTTETDSSGSYVSVATETTLSAISTSNASIDTKTIIYEQSAFGELLISEYTPEVQLKFPYDLNAHLVVTQSLNSGVVSQSNSMAIISTGVDASSSGSLESRQALRYHSGQGAEVRFTALFTNGSDSSRLEAGYGDVIDGFFFGYSGSNFGVMRRQNGTDNWTLQNNWNADKFDGTGPSGVTIDPTKGNVYAIQFQWLGFGEIDYKIEDPNTGKYTLVHRDKYANANTEPSIFNPNLPLRFNASNDQNTTNAIIRTSSAGAFIAGPKQNEGIRFSKSNTSASVSSEINVVHLRNKTTYKTKRNRTRIKVDLITLSTDGNRIVDFNVTRDATVFSSSFADIDLDSVIEFALTGSSVSGGVIEFPIQLGKTDSLVLPLEDSQVIILNPGETLTISAHTANQAGSSEVGVGVSWKELV